MSDAANHARPQPTGGRRGAVLALSALALLAAIPAVAYAADRACEVGAYQAPDHQIVVLTNPGSDPSAAPSRYTLLDGRVGTLGGDALVACVEGAPRLRGADGSQVALRSVPFKLTPTRFASHGVELAGLLVEPPAPGAGTPLVVLVHGSETTRAIGAMHYPYMLAAQGVAAFVYDKRGTGASQGRYTQDFDLLADDAAAAAAAARRLAAGRYRRFGFLGGSQGGWVAPAAALRSKADFVAVGFGLVLTPLEEDAEQVFDELRRRGYDDAVLAKARVVTDATGAVIASHFTSGFAELEQVKARFRNEPWFATIEGEFTGDILKMSEAELRGQGPGKLDNLQIIWRYDAEKVLRSLRAPQLWVLAGSDTVAPNLLTRERLARLRAEGKPIDEVVFPDTEHGMYEFRTLADGARERTRITEGYLRLLADWMKGDLRKPYGSGVFQ